MKGRLLTVDEANALVPRLEIIMGTLQRDGLMLREALHAVAAQGGRTADDLTTAELLERQPDLRPVVDEIEKLLGEIESFGGQLKGLDMGLIDFPARIDGEIVLLCWQFGEKEIAYWHSLEGGFSGRQALPAQRPRSPYLQ